MRGGWAPRPSGDGAPGPDRLTRPDPAIGPDTMIAPRYREATELLMR